RSRVLPVAAPRLWPRRRTMPGLQNAYKEDRGRRTGHTLLPEMPEVGSPDPQEKLLQAFPVFRWSNWRFNISHKFYDSLQPSQELSICWFIRDEFGHNFPRFGDRYRFFGFLHVVYESETTRFELSGRNFFHRTTIVRFAVFRCKSFLKRLAEETIILSCSRRWFTLPARTIVPMRAEFWLRWKTAAPRASRVIPAIPLPEGSSAPKSPSILIVFTRPSGFCIPCVASRPKAREKEMPAILSASVGIRP